MEIIIKSTEKLTHFDGVPVRLWEGTTADGVPCMVFVHRIAVANENDTERFERELKEQLPPGKSFPLSAIL